MDGKTPSSILCQWHIHFQAPNGVLIALTPTNLKLRSNASGTEGTGSNKKKARIVPEATHISAGSSPLPLYIYFMTVMFFSVLTILCFLLCAWDTHSRELQKVKDCAMHKEKKTSHRGFLTSQRHAKSLPFPLPKFFPCPVPFAHFLFITPNEWVFSFELSYLLFSFPT